MSYQVEVAKSNRATCRETTCKLKIGAGDLKIGIQGSDWYSWYHACCAFKTFDNRYIKNRRITSVNDFSNFDSISPEHQSVIRSLIDGTYVEPVYERTMRPRRGTNRSEAEIIAQNADEKESARRIKDDSEANATKKRRKN